MVGLRINGFELTSAEIGPVEDSGEPSFTAVVFRSDGSLGEPLMSVAVDPDAGGAPVSEDGEPADLDGDGSTDGALDGRITSTPSGGVAVTWRLDDGRTAGVGGYGVDEQSVLAYAAQIVGGSLDLATVPAPEGLPSRSVSTIPSGLAAEQAEAIYTSGDGEVRVTARNEPGWFDIILLYGASTYGGFVDAEVGDSFVGPSRAIVSEPAPGHPYALVLTDSGLTIEVSTEFSPGPTSLDEAELRDLLAAGAFIEVEPTDGPPITTIVAAATTTPPTTSTTTVPVAELEPLPTVTRTLGPGGEHIRFTFDDFQPSVGTLTILETLNPSCGRFAADYERIYRTERGDPFWEGWMTIELGARFAADPTAVFVPGEFPYILCSHTADTTIVAFPIANLGEPTVTPLSGLPEILIDVPR